MIEICFEQFTLMCEAIVKWKTGEHKNCVDNHHWCFSEMKAREFPFTENERILGLHSSEQLDASYQEEFGDDYENGNWERELPGLILDVMQDIVEDSFEEEEEDDNY